MNHPFDILQLDNGAAFLFTPCPGTTQVELKPSLEQLAAAGATAVLTLMESDEMERNHVTDLPNFCTALNLQWFHLPIEDDHAPEEEFAAAWEAAGQKIHALVDDGETIAIHCKGGSGRTGLVAAQILLERGMPLDTVIEKIRALRPNSLQVPAHQAYIKKIAGE